MINYYIIIRGPLGCGKSTISKSLAERLNAKCFSIDDVLEKHMLEEDMEDGFISQKNFFKANEIIFSEVKKILSKGNSVIIEGNFYWKSQLEDIIDKLNYPHYIFTLSAPLDVCIERDSIRNISHGAIAAKEVYVKSTEFSYGQIIDVTKKIDNIISEIKLYMSQNKPL